MFSKNDRIIFIHRAGAAKCSGNFFENPENFFEDLYHMLKNDVSEWTIYKYLIKYLIELHTIRVFRRLTVGNVTLNCKKSANVN